MQPPEILNWDLPHQDDGVWRWGYFWSRTLRNEVSDCPHKRNITPSTLWKHYGETPKSPGYEPSRDPECFSAFLVDFLVPQHCEKFLLFIRHPHLLLFWYQAQKLKVSVSCMLKEMPAPCSLIPDIYVWIQKMVSRGCHEKGARGIPFIHWHW